MKRARLRLSAIVLAAATLLAGQAAPSFADAEETRDDRVGSISEVLGPAAGEPPSAAERARIVATLARSFSWTDLAIAWSRAVDRARGDMLLAAIAAQPPDVRAEFFGIATQPGVRSFMRSAALGVVRLAPGTAGTDRVMALVAAMPPAELASPSAEGPIRDAVAARLAHDPEDVEPIRAAWTSFDPVLREIVLDAFAAAGPRSGSRTLSAILVSVRPIDAPSVARLARLPVRSSVPWAPGTHDIVRAALSSDDPVMRQCGARLAARLSGRDHVETLVALLKDPECAADAQSALSAISGINLMADADLWMARLAEEETWAARWWPAERDALSDGQDAAATLAAIERVCARRIHADRILPLLEPLLRSSSADVRVAAIRALGTFGRPESIPLLTVAVLEPDERIASAASSSLAAITGLAAPATPAGWRDLIAP